MNNEKEDTETIKQFTNQGQYKDKDPSTEYFVSGDLGRINLSGDFGQPVTCSRGSVRLACGKRNSNGHSRQEPKEGTI